MATDSPQPSDEYSWSLPPSDQSECPLFSTIPGELRDIIFDYALSEYEDTSRPYNEQTCYRRPDYHAPRRIDTDLLRTCQAIHREAWFRPWTNAEHVFFLTSGERRPPRVTETTQLQPVLDKIERLHGPLETSHIRVFAQLYLLEPGENLQRILGMRHFYPRCVTLTLRHTDWWNWEYDEGLRIAARWVDYCRLPRTVTEFRMELETLERKKPQAEEIAKKMVEGWQFTRTDGVQLCADAKEVSSIQPIEWSGKSTWLGQRWIRDENRPEELDYIVKTIVWRPNPSAISKAKQAEQTEDMQDGPVDEGEETPDDSDAESVELKRRAPDLQAEPRFGRGIGGLRVLKVDDLKGAEVPPGTSGQEASEKIREWKEKQRQAGQAGQQDSARNRVWAVRGQMMGRLRRLTGQDGDGTNNG
ncbi:MAG: hypothetical protein M1831_000487 [Alyxoria varia]|nr:MAG: hypothetical protein M1831_000487 [Alyxoria varia]